MPTVIWTILIVDIIIIGLVESIFLNCKDDFSLFMADSLIAWGIICGIEFLIVLFFYSPVAVGIIVLISLFTIPLGTLALWIGVIIAAPLRIIACSIVPPFNLILLIRNQKQFAKKVCIDRLISEERCVKCGGETFSYKKRDCSGGDTSKVYEEGIMVGTETTAYYERLVTMHECKKCHHIRRGHEETIKTVPSSTKKFNFLPRDAYGRLPGTSDYAKFDVSDD